jgi:dTDP-4-amino-4,6-dideoxygalactose transaminase
MWARTQLKIGWSDLAAGMAASFNPPDRMAERRRAEAYFSDNGDTIAAFSVRSGFDLLIQALQLKPGDEVIFSALNVKAMVRIVREAGLVPVPVDLDLAHMGPSLDKLKAAITPRSRVFIAAHLFGCRLDLDPLFALAKQHGIVAVEDCAQAFNGRDYPGSAIADVNMFSFGPIKTSTALGGALIRVKPEALREKMRSIQATYPVQPENKQRQRLWRFMALKLITTRPVLSMMYHYYTARGRDYQDDLANSVRDVVKLKTSRNLRSQPSATLLYLLNRRLSQFDIESIRARQAKGERLRDLIGGATTLPAQANPHHDYWVFPLLVNEPRKFIDALRAAGFDAADQTRTQHIPAPQDRPELEPTLAAKSMSGLVVIPCYDAMPDSELARQAEVIRKVAQDVPVWKV